MFKKLIAAVLAFVAATAFAAVDINKATLAELEAVKGVGTSTASKIVDERKKGQFKDWADVQQRVKGIKQAKAAKLSAAGLTVNGESFKADADAGAKAGNEKKDAKVEAKAPAK